MDSYLFFWKIDKHWNIYTLFKVLNMLTRFSEKLLFFGHHRTVRNFDFNDQLHIHPFIILVSLAKIENVSVNSVFNRAILNAG